MTRDQERSAETLKIEELRGDTAWCWITEQVGAHARNGDEAGVQRFREIAMRLDQLRRLVKYRPRPTCEI